MVLQPGESTKLDVQFMMHGNMGGKHDFRVHIPTDEPGHSDQTVEVLSNWVP